MSFSHHIQVERISAVCRRRAKVPLDDRLERTLPCVCRRLANQRDYRYIRARCLATTSRAGVDRMIRNAVMKTVNLWASKKVLRLHLTIKTSPCAITRLSSCPLWNFFFFFFFYPSEAGRELFLPLGYFRCFKNHS